MTTHIGLSGTVQFYACVLNVILNSVPFHYLKYSILDKTYVVSCSIYSECSTHRTYSDGRPNLISILLMLLTCYGIFS